jgi:homoserine kinase
MSASIRIGAPPEVAWVSASAPASSANLGCAFDCAAIALNLRQRAKVVRRAEPGFLVTYAGPDYRRVPCDASNLVVQGMLHFAAVHGVEIPGAIVKIENDIPVSMGLGSSAAATVCGLFLGAGLLSMEPDREGILALATKIEGHPDNASAAVHGGLVFAAVVEDEKTVHEAGRVIFARTQLPAGLQLLAIVPSIPTSTRAARAVLPREYSRADLVHNLQRASLLAALCFSGAATLEPELFRDRIHQPYRVPSVPGLAECLAVRHPDLLGVCLSGSGSAALAFVRGSEQEIGRLLAEPLARHGEPPSVLIVGNEQCGARIETGLGVPSIPGCSKASGGSASASSSAKFPCKS